MSQLPLDGITVLDLGQIYNGPYCGYLLAMSGARVIKVESPQGEGMRNASGRPLASYPFTMLNGNKEAITLNLKSERGVALFKDLVRCVDVVVENFSPGTMARLGIGSDVLCGINPGLIYAAATGYGQGGPHRDYRAMDITVQAMTGAVAITGNEGEPPMKCGPAFCDFLGGAHLYAAIATALVRRERTGEGAVLDVAMQDTVFPTLATALGAYYLAGGTHRRTGNRHQGLTIAPYNVYATSDGFVAIICIREGHWRSITKAMGQPELVDDPRFADMKSRAANMEATDAVVEAWTSTLTKDEVFRICQDHDVICAPVQTLDDVLADPHLIERGALQKVAHPTYGEVMLPSTPLRIEGVEPPAAAVPHELGEDNVRILGEMLELSEQEVAALAEANDI